jgi:hypothetical protein
METLGGRLDVQHIIGAVAARHGILLKPDDAAFALVTINQLVLEEVMAELLERVQHAMADFDQAAARVQTRAGSLLASEVKDVTGAIRTALASDVARAGERARELVVEVHQAHSRAALEKWVALGVVCSLLLFVFGVLVGKLLQ